MCAEEIRNKKKRKAEEKVYCDTKLKGCTKKVDVFPREIERMALAVSLAVLGVAYSSLFM